MPDAQSIAPSDSWRMVHFFLMLRNKNLSVELLTINVVQADKGGRIEVSWENLKASVPFSTSL